MSTTSEQAQSYWDIVSADEEITSYLDSVSEFLVNVTSEDSRLVTGVTGTGSAAAAA